MAIVVIVAIVARGEDTDDIWNCIENLSDVGLSIELIIGNGLHMVWKTAFHESSFPL